MGEQLKVIFLSAAVLTSLSTAQADQPITIEIEGRKLAAKTPAQNLGSEVWVPVHPITRALGGHIQSLPGGKGLLICTEKSCTPLRPEQLRGKGTQTLAPARLVGQALGVAVTWDEQRRSVSLHQGISTADGDGLRVGAYLPEITLPDLEGKPVSLAAFRGKKLLLYMWASW